MCGIFGVSFATRKPVGRILTEGLRLLEYRGYDSVGVAISDGQRIVVRKDVGMVDDVSKKLRFEELEGVAGIGHTRWATHGGVKVENAHPHTDCSGGVAVVHNGIIENFSELRAWLKKRGHVFRSETDSEVIAHLFEEFGADETGLKRVTSVLKGTYAFVVLTADGTLLCGRRGSPLVVGRGSDGVFVASDPLPILPYTRRVIRLGEGEYCIARGRELIYRGRSAPTFVKWEASVTRLEGYRYYMEKEIHEQPIVLKRTAEWLRRHCPTLDLSGRVHLVAAGTSYHAALYGAYLLAQAGIDARAFIASEYAFWKGKEPDVIIAVSQSGETADVLHVLEDTKAEIIAVTNVPTSSLAAMADKVLLTQAGPEIGVAATKTFTAQLLVLYYIATGMLPANLPSLVYETLVRNKEVARSVGTFISRKSSAYYLGRGLNIVTALEGALKLKEIAYVHAEGYPAGESKHGPIALVQEGFPVIVVAPKDETHDDTIANAHEMYARGACIVLVSQEPQNFAEYLLSIPYVSDPRLYPLLSVVPLQLVALYAAVERGINPDRPRNLAKSVTVK